MTRYERLRREAKATAERRGHDMENFDRAHWRIPGNGSSECKRCGAYVRINCNPMPNEIDIGGDAVAVNCSDRYQFN